MFGDGSRRTRFSDGQDFVILHAGVGLYQDVVNARGAAKFERLTPERDGADLTTGDALDVTYRIHADVT